MRDVARSIYISTTTTGSLGTQAIPNKRSTASKVLGRFSKPLARKSTRTRLIRYGLLSLNVIVLGAVIGFVFLTSHSNSKSAVVHAVSAASESESNPVDHLTSYDIAANVARATNLPEQKPIANQAQSAKVSLAVSGSSDANVVAKPQIVATALKSKKDIKMYTVLAGEDVSAIAQKFGITSDSVKWSNNLNTNTVNAGTKLTIPPVNGIVYTVAGGDTVHTLATKYRASADQITAYNDAEIDGLKVGEKIIIPGGQQQVTAVAATSLVSRIGSFTATYGGNGYDYGYCTWYVATQLAIPTNWGNANTWAYYAALSGWTVSSTPRVGAVAQTSRGSLGHVGMVQDVSPDGSQVLIRDMNGIAGWGRVGVGWQATSKYEHYLSQ